MQPDELFHAGDALLAELIRQGMSQAELARRTGRPKKTINEIVKGKARLTAESAIQFERVLGVSADWLLYFQANADLFRARRLAEKEEVHE